MAARKRSTQKSEDKAPEAPEQSTTEEVYAGVVAPATPDRVEVRINNKVVFLNDVYGATVDVPSAGGVVVKGKSEAPKSSKKQAEPEFYNPVEQESPAAMGAQVAPVPAPDPEYTEALDESATPDDDEQ